MTRFKSFFQKRRKIASILELSFLSFHEKEKVGEERFWLVLVNELSQKRFKGVYLEYVKEDRYKLGNRTSLYYGTILRPSEKPRNFYVVENVWTDGNFRVSSESFMPAGSDARLLSGNSVAVVFCSCSFLFLEHSVSIITILTKVYK